MRQRKRTASGQARNNHNQSKSGIVTNPSIPRNSFGHHNQSGQRSGSLNRVSSSSTVSRPSSTTTATVATARPPQLVDSRSPGPKPALVRRPFPPAGLNVTSRPHVVHSNMPGSNRAMVVSGNMHRVDMVRTSSSSSLTSNSGTKQQCCCCCIGSMCAHSNNGVDNRTATAKGQSTSSNQPQVPLKDRSIINQTINSGTPNVRLMVKSVIDGTPEMKDLILNELDLIFECRLCKNLFRSLINFLDHKRNYCKTHACESMVLFDPIAIRYNQDQERLAKKDTAVTTPPTVEPMAVDKDQSVPTGPKPIVAGAAKKDVVIVPNGPSTAKQATGDPPSGTTIVSKSKKLDMCLEKLIKEKSQQQQSSNSKNCLPPKDHPSQLPPPPPSSTQPAAKLTSQSLPPSSSTESTTMVPPSQSSNKTFVLVTTVPGTSGTRMVQPLTLSPKKELIIKPIVGNSNAVFQTILPRTPSSHSISSEKSGQSIKVSTPNNNLVVPSGSRPRSAVKKNQSPMAPHHMKPIDPNNNLDRTSKTYSKPNATVGTVGQPRSTVRPIAPKPAPGAEKLKVLELPKPGSVNNPTVSSMSRPSSSASTSRPSSSASNRRPSVENSTSPSTPSLSRDIVECPTCKLKFGSRKTLNVHCRTIHTSTKSSRIMFPCLFCPLTFSQLCNANRHLFVVHKKTRTEINTLKAVMKRGAKPSNQFKVRNAEFERQQRESSGSNGMAIGGQWVNGSGVVGGTGHQIFVADVETVMDDIRHIYDKIMNGHNTTSTSQDEDGDHGTKNNGAADGYQNGGTSLMDRNGTGTGTEDESDPNVSNGKSSVINDHICRGCGKYFPRAAAKLGHEKSCPHMPKRRRISTQSGQSSTGSRSRKRVKLEQRPSIDAASASSIEDVSMNGSIESADDGEDNEDQSDNSVSVHETLAKQLFESNQSKMSNVSNFGIEMDSVTRMKLNDIISITALKCTLCPNQSFASETRLVHHSLMEHIKRSVFKCKGCPFQTIALKDLDNHLLIKHGVKSGLQRSKLMVNLSNPLSRAPVAVAAAETSTASTVTAQMAPQPSPSMAPTDKNKKDANMMVDNDLKIIGPDNEVILNKNPVTMAEESLSEEVSAMVSTIKRLTNDSVAVSDQIKTQNPVEVVKVPPPPQPSVPVSVIVSMPTTKVAEAMQLPKLIPANPKTQLDVPMACPPKPAVDMSCGTTNQNSVKTIVDTIKLTTSTSTMAAKDIVTTPIKLVHSTPSSSAATAIIPTKVSMVSQDTVIVPNNSSSPKVSTIVPNSTTPSPSQQQHNTLSTSGHHLKIVLQRTSPPSPANDDQDGSGHHHHHKKKKKSKKVCYSVTATVDE